jgi:ATP-dependent protease ClpP protease subunit
MKSFKLLVLLIASLSLAFLLSNLCMAKESDKATCKSKYGFTSDCTACHIPPTGEIGYPLPNGVKIHGDIAYIYVEHIDFNTLRDKFLSLKRYKISKIVIDLFSHGGSLFDAMGMVALIKDQEESGKIIEIRARGIIASAGLIVMVAGTRGHRYLDKYAMLMFHELSALKFFSIDTPSSIEEESKIFRMIQNKVNDYIVSRSQISSEELREKIKKRDFWMDAGEAVKYGFADKIMK